MRGNNRNLAATLEAAFDCGITHIETAKVRVFSNCFLLPVMND